MQENSRYLTVYTEETLEAETILDRILAFNGVPEAYLDDPVDTEDDLVYWAASGTEGSDPEGLCPFCGYYHT